jgi:hypothetical protein
LSLSALFVLNCRSILSKNYFLKNIIFSLHCILSFIKITCEKIILRIETAEKINLYSKILKYSSKNWLPQNFDIMYRFNIINFLRHFGENP